MDIDEEEVLKTYTKEDLWERNKILEKALDDMAECYFGDISDIVFPETKNGRPFTASWQLKKYFIQRAKGEKNEKK